LAGPSNETTGKARRAELPRLPSDRSPLGERSRPSPTSGRGGNTELSTISLGESTTPRPQSQRPLGTKLRPAKGRRPAGRGNRPWRSRSRRREPGARACGPSVAPRVTARLCGQSLRARCQPTPAAPAPSTSQLSRRAESRPPSPTLGTSSCTRRPASVAHPSFGKGPFSGGPARPLRFFLGLSARAGVSPRSRNSDDPPHGRPKIRTRPSSTAGSLFAGRLGGARTAFCAGVPASRFRLQSFTAHRGPVGSGDLARRFLH
jgi:hypothetical protein